MLSQVVSKNSSESQKSNCVTLLCDAGYIFPTMVCAKQARANAPSNTDVIVFLDMPSINDELKERLESVSGAIIRLVPADLVREIQRRVPESIFLGSHLTRAAFFRLFVADLVQKEYDRIVYLDGDMQVRRSMAPLFDIPLPDGNVAATPDWKAFHSSDGMPHREHTREYLSGLELSPAQWGHYFNSGMMMASPTTWRSVGPGALEFLARKPEACRWQDQSALNHACRDRVTLVSLRWNFLRHYMPLPAYKAMDPSIVHFVGKLKPWDGAYPPWGRAEFAPYVEMARALEGTNVLWRRQSAARRFLYHFRPYLTKSEYADLAYRAKLNDVLMTWAEPTYNGVASAAPALQMG